MISKSKHKSKAHLFSGKEKARERRGYLVDGSLESPGKDRIPASAGKTI
jgi:hypothetical protein